MKEELIRVLSNKLSNINSDISSLNDLYAKISEESENLDFINGVLDSFKSDGSNDPLNFDKISKEDFSKVLGMTGEEVVKLFNGDACNYDGLVYLISGIRSGIAITLTNEQVNSIEFLIQSLAEKKESLENVIRGYKDEVSKYEISDVSELEAKRDKYVSAKEDVDKNAYIRDIELVKEAINFAELEPSKTIDILSYILEYNAKLYKENAPVSKVEKEEVKEEPKEEDIKLDIPIFEEKKEEKEIESAPEDNIVFGGPVFDEKPEFDSNVELENKVDFTEPPVFGMPVETEETKEEEVEPETPFGSEFHFEQINNNDLFPGVTFNDEEKEETKEEETVEPEVSEGPSYNDIPIEPITFGESLDNSSFQGFKSFDEIINNGLNVPTDTDYVPVTDYDNHEEVEESIPELPDTEQAASFEQINSNITESSMDEEETEEPNEEDMRDEKAVSTRELHKIFGKYGIEENVILNELIDGDINEYQSILDTLKDNSILDEFKKNKELLIETLLYSNTSVINRVLDIIKEDLSTDEEDYDITLKIAINTIPSIFIKEGGNYDNFIANTELFKRLELNLINLFDFSKEVFIADSEAVSRNFDIVSEYNFDITYQNAKYLLLIPNIEDRLDYYIESVYEDKTKNEVFDGIEYIKGFPAKLNVVTEETIKRLRYASINGKKVFGNKPGSLTGEITNLKVNTLDMNDVYLHNFFNNEFKDITPEEVREYGKLTHSSSNVGDYSDELDKLNTYRRGLRYTIEDINVSYYKVVRNYNILRSYGIDAKKALQYAVCHNLVITKDEYNKLYDILSQIGGNV